jgi:ElaB/YqjD/DUF883 family membrane-anchored ribosome-binding protein
MANTTTTHSSAEEIKQRAGEASSMASNVGDKAKQFASGAADKAREFASSATDKARQTASNVGRQAEDATHAAGESIKSFGESIREKGPREGVMGAATSSLASGLECTGQYLQEEGLSGMFEDVTNLVRRNPIPALFVGIGLGFVLARLTVRR